MTVEQTIEHLKTYPPDHKVMHYDYACDLCEINPEDIEQRTVVFYTRPYLDPMKAVSEPRLAQTPDDVTDHPTIQAIVISAHSKA